MVLMPLGPEDADIAARSQWFVHKTPTCVSHLTQASEDGLVNLSFGILRLVVAELGQHTADLDATLQSLVARLHALATTSIIGGKVPAQCGQPWSGIDHLIEKVPFFEPIVEFEALPTKAEPLARVNTASPALPLESSSCLSQEWKAQLVNVFNQIDKDGGGTITTKELRKALSAVGVPRSRAQKLLNAADVDRSGEIDLVEWRKAVERGADNEMSATIKKLARKVAQSGSVSSLDSNLETPRFMIKPGSSCRLLWDAFIAFQCFYISAVLPITVTLDKHIGEVTMAVLNSAALMIDVTFLVDVLLNFRTGYFETSGVLVMDSRKVACAYFRTWFFIDFISSIPVDEITSGQVGSVRFLKVLKIGKLAKVVKFVVLFLTSSTNGWSTVFDFVLLSPTLRSVIRRGGMIIGTVMLCHWLGCFMLLSSDWIETYQDGALYGNWSDMYLAGVYWAMTTMSTVGYGDITPVSNIERLMVLFAMALGGSYYGYAIGTICSILLDRDLKVKHYHERMDQVYFWLDHHKLPTDMRSAVIRHYKSLLVEKAGANESFVFEELSPALKKVIGEFVVDTDIRENPFFDGIPLNAVIRLKTIVHPMVAEAGHNVVASDEVGTAMFIVREGHLRMSNDGSASSQGLRARSSDRLLEPGDSFGEEILVGLAETYQYTVHAMTASKFWMIDEGDFSALFTHMPDVIKTVKKNAAALLITDE